MTTWLVMGGLVLFIYFGIKGMSAGGGDDDDERSSGGGRAVTHNHGSVDQFNNHDD